MDPTRLAQLTDYVKQSRAAGQTYDQVRAAILGGGWSEDEVNEYLPAAWRRPSRPRRRHRQSLRRWPHP